MGSPSSTNDDQLLAKLLSRGDRVSIENGGLKVEPASGVVPPTDWLQKNSAGLVWKILDLINLDGYYYESYSTGCYGRQKYPGVTLQFVSVIRGDSAYAIFNAELHRVRGEKKGKPLPKGQFRVRRSSHFCRYWKRAGLQVPNRLSVFHDYMGNLRGILFTGQSINERLGAGTLEPLTVSYEWIKHAFFTGNCQTISLQQPNNIQTDAPDKVSTPSRADKEFQNYSSTEQHCYGNKVTRETGIGGRETVSCIPQEQSTEEWLDAYEEAAPCKLEFKDQV